MDPTRTLLLVEDNPGDVRLVVEMLHDSGGNMAVESVETQAAAMARLAEADVDVVLLDLGLPDSQGLETFARLHDAAPGIAIIVLTGDSDLGLAIRAVKEGAQDFLVKDHVNGELLTRSITYAIERKQAEQELAESEARYRALAERSPLAIFVSRNNKKHDEILLVNAACEELFGASSPEELVGRSALDLFHPDSQKLVRGPIREATSATVPFVEAQVVRLDGTLVDVDIAAAPLLDRGMPATEVVLRDITERKAAEERMRKLNRVYAVLSGINQAIVRIRQPQALFEEACRVIVEVGDFRAAWVGLVDSDGKHVRAVAQAGAIGSYLDELNIVLGDEERGKGPTGVSISERRHVISQDIEHDPSMAPWRESALRQGYRFSASFPLVVKDEAVGAFSVYGDEPGFFDKEQVHLLDALAMDMSFAMEFAEGEARRRQAEEVIREDEVELQEAQRIGHFGNFDWDARTDTIVWSDEYYRIYGFDPKQPPPGYQEHLKVYSPESAARLDAAVNRSMQTGEPYELDLEQVRPDGTRSWVIARGEVKRDADGKIIGLRGTAQDITERKQGEQKRLRAEKFFRDTFEHADVGIAHVGMNGNWLRVNPRLCDMLGYTREELLATTFAAITHPDDVDENVAAFRSMLAGEKSGYDADKRYLRKDGSIVWVHLNIVLIRKEDGTPDYNLDVITDITERKRAEEVIRADQADLFASREQLRATVERAAVGIARLSLDGRWLDANECLCKMLGYSHDELVGMAFSEITMPETVDRDLEGLGKLVRGEIEQYNCEKRYRTKDGRIIWGDVFSVVARDEEGKPAYLVAVTQDITAHKEAEELAARQAQRIARTLTSVVDIASSIVELRDPYTAGHQRRVSELAVKMAENLGMSGHEIDDIRVAGLLHDMGKAGIPTEILSKPGALSPIEFALIKGHAEAGYRLAVSANMAEPIAEMIYQHHERCDGSGYPRGLTGDQTLLGAKVLAVADVVEAMMSHRPYRPALGIKVALAEIERGTGTLYDARVSEACIRLFNEEGFEFSQR